MKRKPWDARLAGWLITPFIRSEVVQPNHFTTIRLIMGIAGAALFASGTYPNTAALLILVSTFLAHAEGELARQGDKSRRFGHIYDLASEAIVTVSMFTGIGVGIAYGGTNPMGYHYAIMGAIAGVAVSVIFHLRYLMENAHGKTAVAQPSCFGFEIEDILYLMPLVTWFELLVEFLFLSATVAPFVGLLVYFQFKELTRKH